MGTRLHSTGRIIVVAFLLAILAGAAVLVGRAAATSPIGVTRTTIADGTFVDPVRIKFKQGQSGFGDGLDVSRLLVQRVAILPGGSTGWHRHSGPVWVMVQSGTLTIYQENCQRQAIPAGSIFMELAGLTHIARNEGSAVLMEVVTYVLPAGGAVRIDEPQPAGCPIL